jgi:tRNA dimethylallyltransferase
LRGGGLSAMLADLARADAATLARIDHDNPRRVQRAWEVLTATGRGLAAWHDADAAPILPEATADCVALTPDISILNNNIKSRFDVMLEQGALDECARFLAGGGDLTRPSGRALGAAALIAHLEGRSTRPEAIAAAIVATRQYAKRQRTWLRNRMPGWRRIDPAAQDPLAAIPPR